MDTHTLTEVASGFHYLEAPRWHSGQLVFSDFYSYAVYAIPVGDRPVRREEATKLAVVPNQPSGIGWLPDGRLLIVSQNDRRVLVQERDGTLSEYADLSGFTDHQINDMVVDSHGRAYIGSLGFDIMSEDTAKLADLYMVDSDGTASIAAPELYTPNGLLVTPDGKTLLVNESSGNRISAFDIRPDGSLGERRDWARFGPIPELAPVPVMLSKLAIAPDGCTLDAEGAVWTADAAGHLVVRVREGGEVVDEISTGADGAYACALGGDDGQTLFICVAANFHAEVCKANTSGRIVATRVDVPHAGLP